MQKCISPNIFSPPTTQLGFFFIQIKSISQGRGLPSPPPPHCWACPDRWGYYCSLIQLQQAQTVVREREREREREAPFLHTMPVLSSRLIVHYCCFSATLKLCEESSYNSLAHLLVKVAKDLEKHSWNYKTKAEIKSCHLSLTFLLFKICMTHLNARTKKILWENVHATLQYNEVFGK